MHGFNIRFGVRAARRAQLYSRYVPIADSDFSSYRFKQLNITGTALRLKYIVDRMLKTLTLCKSSLTVLVYAFHQYPNILSALSAFSFRIGYFSG